MAAIEQIRVYYRAEAVEQLSRLDTSRLRRADPFWGNLGNVNEYFQNDRAALVFHPDGAWVVIAPYEEDGLRVLHVLGASASSTPAFRVCAEFVDDLARKCVCNRLRFGTFRRGWERLAARYGFSPGAGGYYEKVLA